jgi:hypothetical protein
VSASDGTFHISSLAAGTYSVTVSAAGYNAATIIVNVTDGGTASANASLTPIPSPTPFTPIRVNAGGPAYTDLSGNVWSADTGYLNGLTFGTSAWIASLATPALYQTERFDPGVLEYKFRVPNGNYDVALKFAEIYFNSAGQRVFNIVINGAQLEANFDIFAVAGGSGIPIDKTYTVAVQNGTIDIQLTPVANNPKVSAIQITAAAAGVQ